MHDSFRSPCHSDGPFPLERPSPRQIQRTTVQPIAACNATASTATRGGVPLPLLFLVQLLVVAGSFGGLCSMFVLQHRRQLDKDVDAIVRATLHGGSVALSLPIEQHAYITNQLQLHIQASQTMMPIFSSPFVLSDYFYLFPTMVVPLIDFEPLRWAYQLRNTHLYNHTVSNRSIWHGSGCTPSLCYCCLAMECFAVIGNTSNISQPALLASDYHRFRIARAALASPAGDGNLVATVRSITTTVQHQWGAVYHFVDPVGRTEMFLPLLRCLAFDPDSGVCDHAVGANLHIAYFTEVVHRLSTAGSTVAIVDMRSTFVIAATGNPYDHTLMSLEQAPEHLRGAVTQYLGRCPHNDVSASSTGACQTNVATIGEYIVGVARVVPFECWQVDFLLVHMTPSAHYYAEPERATLVAISVVVAVTLVCIATSVVIYASISSPLRHMARNFQLAAALRNDEVVPCNSAIAEVQRLCRQFHAMNHCLTLARAFLPQSLLETAKDATLAPVEDEEGSVSAKGAAHDAHVMTSSSSDASEDAPAPRAAAPGRFRDEDEDMWRRSSAPASAASHNTSFPANPLAVQGETISPTASSRRLNGRAVVHFDENVEDQHRVAVPIRSQLWQRVSSVGLVTRPVAVVFGNIVGFHSLCEAHGARHAFAAAKVVVGLIQAELAPRRGVLEHLHGDRVMITFNASSDCVDAPRACAEFLLRALEALAEQCASIEGLPFAGMRFGAAAGQAVCGYIGTRSLQRHSVVGPVVHYAWKLMEHAKVVDRLVVMDPRVTDGASPADGFVTESVDLVSFYRGAMLSIQDTFALHSTSGAAPPLFVVRCLVPSAHAGASERQNELANINGAFHHLVHGRLDAAVERIQDGLACRSDAYSNVYRALHAYAAAVEGSRQRWGVNSLDDDEGLLDALAFEDVRRGSQS